MTISSGDIAAMIVALVAALSAYASQRSASKASTTNVRAEAETDAYNRARALDTDSIARLEHDNQELREEVSELQEQVDILKWRLSRYERGLPPAPYPTPKDHQRTHPDPEE